MVYRKRRRLRAGMALVEWDGSVRSMPIRHIKGETPRKAVLETVDPSAAIMTDELPACRKLEGHLAGIHHQMSKKHLHRYCTERSFMWDHRKVTDGEADRRSHQGRRRAATDVPGASVAGRPLGQLRHVTCGYLKFMLGAMGCVR